MKISFDQRQTGRKRLKCLETIHANERSAVNPISSLEKSEMRTQRTISFGIACQCEPHSAIIPPMLFSSSSKKRVGALSLLELVVVIALVALLAALLLPGLQRAKQSALSVQCKSNLRQQQIALALYVNDFSRFLPDFALRKQLHLEKYVSDGPMPWGEGVFRCPAVQMTILPYPNPNSPDVAEYGRITYAYNDRGTDTTFTKALGLAGENDERAGIISGLPETKVAKPGDMIAIGDIGAWGTIWFHDRPLTRQQDWLFSIPAHDRGTNLVFCDGHVQFLNRATIEARTDAIRRKWNDDNDPHPETWK